MRLRCFCLASFTVFIAACASSTPGGQPDADVGGPPDAQSFDANVPDAGPPDAVPCIPDPDGETCNGNDDDCDGSTDEGYPGVGDACEVGVGACLVAGTTVCTADGTSTECGATPGTPGDELCSNAIDDDCDSMTDEGFPNLGQPCSVGAGQCFAQGVFVCSSTGLTTTCNATPGDPEIETCDGQDDDCDLLIDEGFNVNLGCDGADADLCIEGVYACDGAGGAMCTDASGSTFDVCNGADDDCDPSSADGSEDGAVGVACDGAADSDLCLDAASVCSGGGIVCPDGSASTVDLCGGGDEDCDPASADGSEHPGFGVSCDGAGDTDLCQEGTMACSGTALVCNDTTGSTTDLCGGGDQDCDPASADGSEHPGLGTACDGGDGDVCIEGTNVCSGTSLACSDATGTTVEACNGDAVDEDCDGTVDDGFVRDDNPACGTPFYIGAITGDSGGGGSVVTDSYFDEEWDRVRITEDDDLIVYLSGKVQLYSPPGVDFDLYVYCVSCGGSLIGSSTLGGLTGHTDTVDVRNNDDWGSTDDFDIIIEVRHFSSNRCAYWNLTVTGDLAASTNNCDT